MYTPLLLARLLCNPCLPSLFHPLPSQNWRTPRSSKFGQLLEGSQWRQKPTGKNVPVGLKSHRLGKVDEVKSALGLITLL
jgi:hypothetical protein